MNTVGAGGLGLSPRSCLPRLHTGLTPLSFHCCWFGTNPSNFLQRQDKMCLPYLYIYSTSHIPLFTLLFSPPNACLQMRVCVQQIRHTQPRTEGTKSTRNKKEKKKSGERGRRNSPKGDNKTYSAHAFYMSYIKLHKI